MMFPLYLKRTPEDEAPTEPIAYVVGKNGTFMQKTTAIFRATLKCDSLPMLSEVKESAEYLLPPMPAVLVARILFFFRAIYDRDKSEAIVLITYNTETRQFGLVAPEQSATGAHVRYDMPQIAPSGFRFIGTIHSHGSMGAFHSGTDTHDEAHFDGVHLTVGYLDRSRVAVVAALAINGRRQTLSPERILGGLRFEKWTPQPVEKPVEKPAPVPEEKESRTGFPSLDSLIDFFGHGLSRKALKKLKHGQSIERRRAEEMIERASRPSYHSNYSSYWNEGFVLDLPPDATWQQCLPPSEWNDRVAKPVVHQYNGYAAHGYQAHALYGSESDEQLIGFQQPYRSIHRTLGRHITPVPNKPAEPTPPTPTPVPVSAPGWVAGQGWSPYGKDSGETSVPVEVPTSAKEIETTGNVTTEYTWGDREGGES